MSTFVQQLINAASLGATYCILAMGITLSLGLARLANFAHAAFGVLAAFIAWDLADSGWNIWVAIGVSCALVSLLAVAVFSALLGRTINRPLNGFIVSLGILLIMQALMAERWGIDTKVLPSLVTTSWEMGDLVVTGQRAVNFFVSMALTVGLLVILKFTSFGRSVRAVAEDSEASQIIGVNSRSIIRAAFVIGTGLAAVAGVLLAMVIPFGPYSGNSLLIKAFAVAIVGGLGNVVGAICASFLLALVETMGAAYWQPEWVPAYSLAAIVIVLLVRPNGLFRSVGAADAGFS